MSNVDRNMQVSLFDKSIYNIIDMNKKIKTEQNKIDVILLNKKDFIIDNKLLNPIIDKAGKDAYKSYQEIYESMLTMTTSAKDWALHIQKDIYEQYLEAIKNLYLHAWDNCKAKTKESLDDFSKIAFWINTSQSQIAPVKGKSRKDVIHVKLEDMVNIANILHAMSLFCDNEQFKKTGEYYGNICDEYIVNFTKMLENDWNKSFEVKPSDMAERIRSELQK